MIENCESIVQALSKLRLDQNQAAIALVLADDVAEMVSQALGTEANSELLDDEAALQLIEQFRENHDRIVSQVQKPQTDAEQQIAELVQANQQLQAELNEYQHTRSALQMSQAQLAGIVEIADDAIISINQHYDITLFNRGAEKIFGYTAAEAIGQSLDLLMPHRFANVHRQHVQTFGHATHTTQRMDSRREIWGRRKDGTEFPAEASISKLEMDGEIIYTVYLRDITERKQIDRMKDEFISMVSHELRTPLTSIHGSLGMLTSGLLKASSEQGKRLLKIAVESTDRLVRLINDILDIERIESGQVKMEKSPCELADLIRAAIDLMNPLAEKSNITLSASISPIVVEVDRDRILQTLTNLLSNAIKFSPMGSTICVSTTIEADRACIMVSDQGRGIPADKIESIFERFQQVDSSDSRNQDGTGLGLAICRSIIQQHDGKIWVESEVNLGSKFYFTLPISQLRPQPALESSTPRLEERSTHSAPLVLVCNDAIASQPILESLLERQGYRVTSVPSAQAALTQATLNTPDVILLLGSHAWETMAFLKQQPVTSEIPLLICRVSLPNFESDHSSIDPATEAELFELLREALSPSSHRIQVLIVEDDSDLAEMLKILFERHGIATIRAKTGREAIQLSQQLKPDLLVLDLVLPEGDGFSVVDWLQQHSQLCRTPLIVYSVKELDGWERDRLTLGTTEFLTKGRVTIQEFEQRVMALLQQITQAVRMV